MADGTIKIEMEIDSAKAAAKSKTVGEDAGKGIGSGLEKGTSEGADKAAGSVGKIGLAGAAAAAAVVAGAAAGAAALVNLSKSSLDAYASYEQLVGGVDTLFKGSSQTVQDYANNAYQTAGMSANQYMETITGFSASLIGSLGGDTAAAAELGNVAVTDMSDNANKMGTDITSIQQTYSSLARGNYAMLDNLKLGYGGTKEEMQRLIDDANKLEQAQGNATHD